MPDWPHAPPHRLSEKGAYMVTCSTLHQAHFLNQPEKLDTVRDLIFSVAAETGWQLHAWAILSNHYHLIISSPDDPSTLNRMVSKIHTLSASEINVCDHQPGRRVWFQFFDSHITFVNSYLARLNYVHNNPVHHGIVAHAENYPWCSAGWFARTARPAFRKTVLGFKTDSIRVADAFLPIKPVSMPPESGVKPPHSK